jgi:hypothetical protein
MTETNPRSSHDWFEIARSKFARECQSRQLYYTLCLLGAAELSVDGNLPALGAMSNIVDRKIRIIMHPDMEKVSQDGFNFVMFHEIRHIIQCSNLSDALELLDLSPLLQKAQRMAQKATTQNTKQRWIDWADSLADTKNPGTRKLLLQACNIGMDVAVNTDGVKLLGADGMNSVDAFIKSRVEPEEIEKILKQNGGFIGCVTKSRLEALLGWPLREDAEWVYYANEYLKKTGEDGEGEDPDEDAPRYVSMDSHDGIGALSDDEATQTESQHTTQRACARAEDEAVFRSKKAGREMGDAAFTARHLKLDRKVQKLLDAMKFKIKACLKPSPEEQYTFQRDNRLWPGKGFPGTENIMKPMPAVVLVIDVSGSCWEERWLNQMVAAGKHLLKKKTLASMWSFDTGLDPIDIAQPNVVLRGCGGTVWQTDFTDRIIASLPRAKRIDLILMSDMYIIGLAELEKDKRVALHPIDITKYLK